MRSSTSSSDERRPSTNWRIVSSVTLLLALVSIVALEATLAVRGIRPGEQDSEFTWLRERWRASLLGARAVIVVGSSRAQLDFDLHELAAGTGLVPVQLAIDGNPYLPVLEGLADDQQVSGTIIVEYSDAPSAAGADGGRSDGRAEAWSDAYRRLPRWWSYTFDHAEGLLAQRWRSTFRAYADGTRPLTALLERALVAPKNPQYLVTTSRRERYADYSRVTMPEFYYQRVGRTLGATSMTIPPGTPDAVVVQALAAEVAKAQPLDDSGVRASIARVAGLVQRIEARGGRVIFVRLPSSGLVRDWEERTYPRQLFWGAFAAGVGVTALHFADEPLMSGFTCPDGSHLDGSDAGPFTRALLASLRQHGEL